ncbi:uncharacterized protein LOC143372899 [Andrena cerasifolii]|uniref:uncharacterized protein LOC143372899 n=1 Tax=Andrena cerasifolii TaxID=2819439 RepID=UPI004037A0F3
MPNCIVKNCGNRTSCKSSKQEALEEQIKISFHRVPKNVTNRRLWLKNLGLEESYIPNDAVVCSLHFNSEDYDRTSLSRLRLKAHAIPYVLKEELNDDFIVFAEPLEEIQRCESPMKSECTLPTSDKGVQATRSSENKATCMSPSRQFHAPGKEELREHAARMKKSYQYEIKILKQKYRRSTNKIQTLEAMVQTLRQKILLQENSHMAAERSSPRPCHNRMPKRFDHTYVRTCDVGNVQNSPG